MNRREISASRLSNQHIAGTPRERPEDAVRDLCALQAQDYAGMLWAVGLRTRDATQRTVREAIDKRRIIRTWLLRGTLHAAAPEDIRWILALTAGWILAGARGRHRQLGLTDEDFERSRAVLVTELRGGGQLTRGEIFRALTKVGISTEGQRGYHLLWKAGIEGILCYGPHRGTEPTFVLMDDWVPESPDPMHRGALADLALRYFSGHGPATLQDFVWWSGLTVSDAKAGIAGAGSALSGQGPVTGYYHAGQQESAGAAREEAAYLLPGFDEFLVGYRDRSAVISAGISRKGMTGSNGMMLPVVVIDGQVAGTWKREMRRDGIRIRVRAFRDPDPVRQRLVEAAAERYGRFMESPVTVQW